MALTAASPIAFVATAHPHPDTERRSSAPRCVRAATFAVLAATLFFLCPASSADADETAIRPVAAEADDLRITIVLRAPARIVDGDRVTLHSMLRFSGRAWDEARIEILANGVVVSETFALPGGLWYAPRTEIPAGEYEFTARAVAPDGTREMSDVLRITVSPPILLDPESLAGKSIYSVG